MHPWQHLMLVTVLQSGRVQNSVPSYFGSLTAPVEVWFLPALTVVLSP